MEYFKYDIVSRVMAKEKKRREEAKVGLGSFP